MRLFAGFAAVFIALANPAQAASEWQEYAFPDQQFAVSLPERPSVTRLRSGQGENTVTETLYVVQQQDCRFEVAVFDLLPSGMDENTAISRAAATLREKGEASVDIAAEVQGHWGRFFSLKRPDGSHMIAGVYMRNERLFEIAASAPAETFNAVSSDMVRFQQSLRFTGSPRSRRFAFGPDSAPLSLGGKLFGPGRDGR